ncbi:MAG: FecR domain-containing protein [Opitutaceae bacterium]|nr:FecR domain-containing protein [Opitutaceae bacterium]
MDKQIESTLRQEEAARWLARRDAGLSAAEAEEFAQWLAAAPAHREAWAELESMWTGIDRARDEGLADEMMRELERRRQRRQRTRWRAVIGLAAAAVVAAGITVIFHDPSATKPTPGVAAYQTGGHAAQDDQPGDGIRSTPPASDANAVILRPQQRRLADGSVVELNEHALISVDFTAEVRTVQLLSGTAHFEIKRDPARPFVVRSGPVTVRAVGTAFVVEQGEDAADVLVTEGLVDVSRQGEPAAAQLRVGRHGQVLMTHAPGDHAPEVSILSAAEVERRLLWRAPKLKLRGAALAEVVELLNQMNRTQLVLGDPALAELRFSGIFRADNAEGFVQMLENYYGVRATRTDNNEYLLHSK